MHINRDLSPCFCAQGPEATRGHKNPEDPPTPPRAMWGHELFEAGECSSASSASDTADLFHVRRKILSIILPGGIVFTFILKLTIFVSEMT